MPHTVAVGLSSGSALQDSSLHLQLPKEAATLVAQLHQETCQKLSNAARFTINLPQPAARGIQEEGKLWDDFMSRIYVYAHVEVHLCGSLSPKVTFSSSFISLQTLVKPRSWLLPCNNNRLILLVFPIRLQKWFERCHRHHPPDGNCDDGAHKMPALCSCLFSTHCNHCCTSPGAGKTPHRRHVAAQESHSAARGFKKPGIKSSKPANQQFFATC